jgi:hypothetical protein
MPTRLSQHPLRNDPLVQQTVAALAEVSGNDHLPELLDEDGDISIVLDSGVADGEIVSVAVILGFSQHLDDLQGRLPQDICAAARILKGDTPFNDQSGFIKRLFEADNAVAVKFMLAALGGAYGSEEMRRKIAATDDGRLEEVFARALKNTVEINDQLMRRESWQKLPGAVLQKYAAAMEGFVNLAPDDWMKKAALGSLQDVRDKIVAAETSPVPEDDADGRAARLKETSKKYQFKPK